MARIYYCANFQQRLICLMFEGTFETSRKKDVIQVKLNNNYELKEGDQYFETIEVLVDMVNEKNSRHKFEKVIGAKFFSSLEFILGKRNMKEEQCSICLEEFVVNDIERELFQEKEEDVYSLPCSHIYHYSCLTGMLGGRKWLKCPVCMSIYGKMTGDMPDGSMTVAFDKNLQCQGYGPGTITIAYSMKGYTRNGVNIPGTSRVGYLPDTQEGREVLQLLRQCFDRKLTFTVGRSVTTGRDNQIVWNGIHHKTSTSGGAANFGYPDPTYLKRVKEELAAKGIVSQKGPNHQKNGKKLLQK